jgi:hypothetical protein
VDAGFHVLSHLSFLGLRTGHDGRRGCVNSRSVSYTAYNE